VEILVNRPFPQALKKHGSDRAPGALRAPETQLSDKGHLEYLHGGQAPGIELISLRLSVLKLNII
jgi:hypothetical protein